MEPPRWQRRARCSFFAASGLLQHSRLRAEVGRTTHTLIKAHLLAGKTEPPAKSQSPIQELPCNHHRRRIGRAAQTEARPWPDSSLACNSLGLSIACQRLSRWPAHQSWPPATPPARRLTKFAPGASSASSPSSNSSSGRGRARAGGIFLGTDRLFQPSSRALSFGLDSFVFLAQGRSVSAALASSATWFVFQAFFDVDLPAVQAARPRPHVLTRGRSPG